MKKKTELKIYFFKSTNFLILKKILGLADVNLEIDTKGGGLAYVVLWLKAVSQESWDVRGSCKTYVYYFIVLHATSHNIGNFNYDLSF